MVEPKSIFDPYSDDFLLSCDPKLINNDMSTTKNEKKSFATLQERSEVIFNRFAEQRGIPATHLQHKDICRYFGWSPGKWQAWRDGTTLKMNSLDAAAISDELGIDYNWLATGHGDPFTSKETFNESLARYEGVELGLLTKAKKVLESDSVYSRALESNIEAFYAATTSEQELAKIKKEKEGHDERIAKLEEYIKQLPSLRDCNEA